MTYTGIIHQGLKGTKRVPGQIDELTSGAGIQAPMKPLIAAPQSKRREVNEKVVNLIIETDFSDPQFMAINGQVGNLKLRAGRIHNTNLGNREGLRSTFEEVKGSLRRKMGISEDDNMVIGDLKWRANLLPYEIEKMIAEAVGRAGINVTGRFGADKSIEPKRAIRETKWFSQPSMKVHAGSLNEGSDVIPYEEVECPYCESVFPFGFEFLEEDEEGAFVTCPSCKSEVAFTEEQLEEASKSYLGKVTMSGKGVTPTPTFKLTKAGNGAKITKNYSVGAMHKGNNGVSASKIAKALGPMLEAANIKGMLSPQEYSGVKREAADYIINKIDSENFSADMAQIEQAINIVTELPRVRWKFSNMANGVKEAKPTQKDKAVKKIGMEVGLLVVKELV